MTLTSSRNYPLLVAHGDAYSELTTTQLSGPNVAGDIFEQGKRAYANHSYDEAVDSFTRTIEILRKDLSTALLHRAAALEMKRDYDSALQDSILANPDNKSTVPDPYFTAANALLLQDKLREASLHLHFGTAAVSPTCVQYPALVQLREQVLTEMNMRNRRMATVLPHEVLNQILSLLHVKDCIRLSLTCHFWNSYILQEWSDRWSTIIDSWDGGDLPTSSRSARQRVLESIPPTSVRSLELSSTFRMERSVLETICQKRWNKLEHLRVHELRKKDIFDILQVSKDSISDFELLYGGASDYPSYSDFQEVLIEATTCSNIQSITAHYPDYHQLTSQLQSSSMVLSRITLYNPCKSRGNLFGMRVEPVKECARALIAINEQCPMLQELVVDSANHRQNGITTTYSPRASVKTGLTSLKVATVINDNYEGVKRDRDTIDEQIRLIVRKNHPSLQSLALPLFDKQFRRKPTLLLEIARVGLPVLTDLKLTFYYKCLNFDPHDLRAFIAACPALEKVIIYGCSIWDTGVFEELAKLACLQQLDIDMGYCVDITNTISDAKNGVADMVKQSRTLRSFSFGYGCHDINRRMCVDPKAHDVALLEIARSIAGNTAINELDLINVSIESGAELVSVLESVKDSQLRIMRIKTYCSFEDEQIQAIASLRNVTMLKIEDCRGKLDKQRLIQIFNEHDGGQKQFVIGVNHSSSRSGFIGRKQYPVDNSVDHLQRDNIKDESYFTSLYAISRWCYKRDYQDIPICIDPRIIEANETTTDAEGDY